MRSAALRVAALAMVAASVLAFSGCTQTPHPATDAGVEPPPSAAAAAPVGAEAPQRQLSLGGTVRDREGRCIAGAVVRFCGRSEGGVTTDAAGRFSLDWGEPPGEGSVTVRATGFLDQHALLAAGATDHVVEMTRARRVEGVVLHPDGKPARGAQVGDALGGSVWSDDSGEFQAEVAWDAREIRAVWHPRDVFWLELEGRTPLNGPDGVDESGIVIRIESPWNSYVSVRITDADGRPFTDVPLAGGMEVRGDVIIAPCTVPAGTRHVIRIYDSPHSRRWPDLWIEAVTQASPGGPAVEVRLPAPRELTVEARGIDGRELPQGSDPRISLGERAWFMGDVSMVREERASATWSVFAGRPYFVHVYAEGFASFMRAVTEEEMASGRLVAHLQPGVTVRGRVVSTDRAAVRGAMLFLVSDRSDVRSDMGLGERGDDGVFRCEHVAAGPWRLWVRWPRATVIDVPVLVPETQDVDLGTIVVPPQRVLRGVVELDGLPCAGVRLQTYFEGVEWNDDEGWSREDGSFEIGAPSLPGGVLLARRRGRGAVLIRLDGTDPSKPLTVKLAPPGAVDLHVRMLREPWESWSFLVRTPDGAAQWDPEVETDDDRPGHEARFRLVGLPAGPLIVRPYDWEWKVHNVEGRAEVIPGKAVRVVLDPDR